MAWIGRPKKYNSAVEKMKAYRESKKRQGAVRIDCYIPSKYAAMMSIVRHRTEESVSKGICLLLDTYFEKFGTELKYEGGQS